MSDPIRVVLADDSVLLREGLARLLEDSGFEVAGQSGDAEDLLRKVGAHQPDVAVVDVRMPPSHTDEGLRAAHQIRADHPGVGVLVLSQYVEEAYALELLSESTERTGYLLKDRVADVDTFTDAVRRVAGGGSALDPEVVALLLGRRRREDPLEALTPREREVLGLMAEGRSNAAIAARARRHRARGREARHLDLHQARPHARRRGPPAGARGAAVPAVELRMTRLPVLALLAVLAGSFAFHAYRAEHPTSSYQSADERAYGRLAVGIADEQTYGNGLEDALHWPPGGADAVRRRPRDVPGRGERGDVRHPRGLLAAGDRLARHRAGGVHDRGAAGGRLGGRGRGGARRLLPAADPRDGRAAHRAVRRVLADARVRAVRGRRAAAGRAWVFGLGGLALGAAVLTRADLLPVPFVLAPLVAVWTWRAARDLRRGLLVGGLILGGAVLAIAPWSVYASSARASSCRSRAGRARRCSSAPTCPATGPRWG